VPAAQLRLACWQASRFGLETDLLDPVEGKPRPASDVLAALLDHVRPVLEEQGELAAVELLLFQVMARGTGAVVQREWFAQAGSLPGMIAKVIDVTALPASAVRGQAARTRLRRDASPHQLHGKAPTRAKGVMPQLDNQTL
jgi:carboxylate-amine ligase